ncbi:hypothetical protein OG900_29115 [Streptomyces sp. NBC_00433]
MTLSLTDPRSPSGSPMPALPLLRQRFPLATPSGRIEILSEEIDSFCYDDCAGHPTWFEPAEWLRGDLSDRFPLHLISNQPAARPHSQYDGTVEFCR